MSSNRSTENYPIATDISVGGNLSTPISTISRERLERLVSQETSGAYSTERVISPPMTIAVRQEHPGGPSYQEALSYTFLIHSMKFARLTQMDDGRLVMIATGWLEESPTEERICFMIYSDDEGNSWTQPREIHRGLERPEPVNLGSEKLLIIPNDDPGFTCISHDKGQTWGEKRPFPTVPDGRVTTRHGTVLVEGLTVSGVFTTERTSDVAGWTAESMIRRSRDGGHTWNEGIWLPPQWQVSEGSLVRAADGALVVSLRTAQAHGMPSYCDHWRRITTARSLDDGSTWTDHQIHFDYGKVHSGLVRLSTGDILMTYAARMGELDGEMYHGIEAVLSRDCGQTWDWDNRFILFRWAMHQGMHSPVSVELSDGRILTVFLFHYDAPWNNGSFSSKVLGMTAAVYWSPYADEGSPQSAS